MCLDTKLSQGEAALYMGTNLWAGKARRFTGLQQVLGTDLEGRARRPLGLRPCNVHFVKDILVFSILTQPVTCNTKSHFGDLKANSLSYLRGITYDLGSPSVPGMHHDQIQVGGIKGSLDSNTQSFPFILQHDALWHGGATAAVGLIPSPLRQKLLKSVQQESLGLC